MNLEKSSRLSEKAMKTALCKVFAKHSLLLCGVCHARCHKYSWHRGWLWRAKSIDGQDEWLACTKEEDRNILNIFSPWTRDYGQGKWTSMAKAIVRGGECRLVTRSGHCNKNIVIAMPKTIEQLLVEGDLL